MAKMTKCKTCGADVAKSAVTCPACGAKLKKKHPVLGGLLLLVGIIIIVGVVFGMGSNSPEKTSSVAGSSSAAASAKTSEPVYTVGETLELKGVQATLSAVRCNKGSGFNTAESGRCFIICEFEIVNNSSSEIAVSSLLSFKAYVDDYTLEYSLSGILSDGGKQLDGAIDPEKKIHGIVAFNAPDDWAQVEIRFAPNVWTGKDFIYIVDREQAK